MIFRQLFEPLSSTYTYLIGCEHSRQAALIDPVYPTWERDLQILKELNLNLAYTLETHVHADHITSALKLRQETGSKIVFPKQSAAECPDLVVEDGSLFKVGDIAIHPLYTPGHTDDHFAYGIVDKILTGDALLIDGCGRTDFQNGNADQLYNSIHTKLFSLPDDTLVYPGHDYNQRHVSTILQEKERNPRLGNNKDLTDFIELMNNLNLPYPKFIDYAVPGNKQCGVCPADLPENMDAYCHKVTESRQG
ncbi:MAG: MBL fold metallo-hydrolase [Porticoccaceae bacterium]|jgi:glyoxylase-like metal-dependent hydrolase (beta-lactamase superfamily II)